MPTRVAVVPGDGIGQEVVPAAVRVLKALPVALTFESAAAGDQVRAETGTALPAATKETVTHADVTLFGAAGESAADVILPLRELVGAYANVRPVRAYPGTEPLHSDVDLVFVRENTEGVYSGIESEITDGVTTLTRVITEEASRNIAAFGFEYAATHDYPVTIAHKANVMQVTDGQFLDTTTAVADQRDASYETALIDALAMHLVTHPEDYGVIISPNLAGDVLSDLAAGLVGGLGLLPSANLGHEQALFEPVHGTAPDIAGAGIANPTAMFLSAALLLEYLDHQAAADRLRAAVETTLAQGPRTPDLGGDASTTEVTDAVIDRL